MRRLKDMFSCRINPLGSSKSLWVLSDATRRRNVWPNIALISITAVSALLQVFLKRREKITIEMRQRHSDPLCFPRRRAREWTRKKVGQKKEWGWRWGGAAHWYLEPEHELALSAGLQSDYLESDLPRWMVEPCPPWWCLSVLFSLNLLMAVLEHSGTDTALLVSLSGTLPLRILLWEMRRQCKSLFFHSDLST